MPEKHLGLLTIFRPGQRTPATWTRLVRDAEAALPSPGWRFLRAVNSSGAAWQWAVAMCMSGETMRSIPQQALNQWLSCCGMLWLRSNSWACCWSYCDKPTRSTQAVPSFPAQEFRRSNRSQMSQMQTCRGRPPKWLGNIDADLC